MLGFFFWCFVMFVCFFLYLWFVWMDKLIGSLLLLWLMFNVLWIVLDGYLCWLLFVIFMFGMLLMCLVGCVMNDYVDCDFDCYVKCMVDWLLMFGKIYVWEVVVIVVGLLFIVFLLILLFNMLMK